MTDYFLKKKEKDNLVFPNVFPTILVNTIESIIERIHGQVCFISGKVFTVHLRLQQSTALREMNERSKSYILDTRG